MILAVFIAQVPHPAIEARPAILVVTAPEGDLNVSFCVLSVRSELLFIVAKGRPAGIFSVLVLRNYTSDNDWLNSRLVLQSGAYHKGYHDNLYNDCAYD